MSPLEQALSLARDGYVVHYVVGEEERADRAFRQLLAGGVPYTRAARPRRTLYLENDGELHVHAGVGGQLSGLEGLWFDENGETNLDKLRRKA